jgi:NAD(P)H dehydrogenase (quinone)
MKIGIIIHSQSGATAKVARALSTALTAQGHEVDTTLLRTVGKVAPRSSSFEIKNAPVLDEFDTVILGGPVWAFAISSVIIKYARQLGKLSGKKVLCFVVKGLPFYWTGGNQALRTLEGELALSNAIPLKGEIIHAHKVRRETTLSPFIERMVEAICG